MVIGKRGMADGRGSLERMGDVVRILSFCQFSSKLIS